MHHPWFYPTLHPRTVRKHKVAYGIAPLSVSGDGNAQQVEGLANVDHCPPIASPIESSDEHHEDHDSEDDYDHEPLLGSRGRPKSHFRILNLPAAELALDVIRKHHLSDAAANDMIAVISATSVAHFFRSFNCLFLFRFTGAIVVPVKFLHVEKFLFDASQITPPVMPLNCAVGRIGTSLQL